MRCDGQRLLRTHCFNSPHHYELPGRLGVHKCLQRHFLALSGLRPRRGSKAPLVAFMNYPELLPNGPCGPEFGSFGQVVRNVEVHSSRATLVETSRAGIVPLTILPPQARLRRAVRWREERAAPALPGGCYFGVSSRLEGLPAFAIFST